MHFRVKGEDSRTQRRRPGAAPPASRRSTCHQHPDCNTPLPIRVNRLLKQRWLILPIRGGLGIWWLIDLIMIAIGSFTDIEGRAITYQSANTANTAPSTHVPEKVVEAPPAKDIPAEIEKLADLKDKGIITDEEFQQKKQELLDRI